MNLLHISIGNHFPDIVNSIVEIPKDTNAKYEYDINYGILRLDRCLISSMRYPTSYGFVPQTISDDGDPLDILIYNTVPIQSLALVEVRPIEHFIWLIAELMIIKFSAFRFIIQITIIN
jgi:inorganic pyrophosphatase